MRQIRLWKKCMAIEGERGGRFEEFDSFAHFFANYHSDCQLSVVNRRPPTYCQWRRLLPTRQLHQAAINNDKYGHLFILLFILLRMIPEYTYKPSDLLKVVHTLLRSGDSSIPVNFVRFGRLIDLTQCRGLRLSQICALVLYANF